MEKLKIEVDAVRCERCGFVYSPKVSEPVKCPRCQHTFGTKVKKPIFVKDDNKHEETLIN